MKESWSMKDRKYRQILVLSGKGGTGKTTVSSALSKILSDKITIDCDVDAANLFLLLESETKSTSEFFGGKKSRINIDLCSRCGICESLCRFNAIDNFVIDSLSCEGCGLCYRACPNNAIEFETAKSGDLFKCKLEDMSDFYFGRLLPGEGNSGKMVSELKQMAAENIDDEIKWIIIDGPPGIGCPVTSSLSGTDFVILVTEPTESGIHDLKRIIQLINSFSIKCGILINKYNLNSAVTKEICRYAEGNNIPILGELPYDQKYVEAIKNNETIVEYDKNAKYEINKIWSKVESYMNI